MFKMLILNKFYTQIYNVKDQNTPIIYLIFDKEKR